MQMLQFICAGLALAIGFGTLVAALAAGIVRIMKGARYSLDPYPLPERHKGE